MYTKDFTVRSEFQQKLRQTVGVNSSTIYDSRSGLVLSGFKSGERVPDFRAKIKQNRNATSRFVCDVQRVGQTTFGNASCGGATNAPFPAAISASQTYSGFARFNLPTAHLAASMAEADATALTKTYSKIRSEYQRFSGASFVAELLDVLRQFGRPLQSVMSLYERRLNRLALEARGLRGSTAFKRKNFTAIVKDSYLEWSFGLDPLISDAKSLAEAVAEYHIRNGSDGIASYRSKVVGRGETELSTHVVDPIEVIPNSWLRYQAITMKSTHARMQYVVGLDAGVYSNMAANDRLVQILGFNARDWIPAVWEAVPWSWLADYFLNVQSILEAGATSQAGVTWISKTSSVKTSVTVATPIVQFATLQAIASAGYPNSRFAGGHVGQVSLHRTTVDRTSPASLGVPPLICRHPVDTRKLANMFAALWKRRNDTNKLWLGIGSN